MNGSFLYLQRKGRAMNILNDEKVIVILTDGMHPDAIKLVPKAQKFYDEAASTLNGKSVMPAVTMPCHMSLFKAVEPTVHNCIDNYDPAHFNPVKGICEVLRRRDRKTAMFYTWGELRDLSRPGVVAYDCFINASYDGVEDTSKKLTHEAIRYLKDNFTSFTFIHYDVIDVYGHWYGWMTDKYIDGVKFVWEEIYKLLEVVDDDTTVIILSDHSGHDTDHGIESDTQIPVMIKSKFFKGATELKDVSIKDIAPTICKILEVQPDPDWEGKALF